MCTTSRCVEEPNTRVALEPWPHVWPTCVSVWLRCSWALGNMCAQVDALRSQTRECPRVCVRACECMRMGGWVDSGCECVYIH